MNPKAVLPKRLVNYIHDTGVRALDNLADNFPQDGGQSAALQSLINQWKGMSKGEKEEFVDGVAASVIEVIALSALIPVGAKLGKKAIKSARKAIKRRKKALKKSVAGKKKTKKSQAA